MEFEDQAQKKDIFQQWYQKYREHKEDKITKAPKS